MNAEAITWEQLLDPAQDAAEIPCESPQFSLAPEVQAGTAWWLATLSHLSYRSARQGRVAIAHNAGLEERYFCQVGAAQCSLYVSTAKFPAHQPVAILAFKGTDSLRQWISNVDTLPIAWTRGGHVHGGFAKAFASIWDELAPRMELLDMPLFITGHSLGGALATLATSQMEDSLVAATYTFGAPRVGNAEFVRGLDGAPLFRMVNHLDLVCSLPRPISISRRLSYSHAGSTVLFNKDGDRVHPPELGETDEPSIRNMFLHAFQTKSARPPRALADHAVQLYIDRTRRMARRRRGEQMS